jgi:hypothetical protein
LKHIDIPHSDRVAAAMCRHRRSAATALAARAPTALQISVHGRCPLGACRDKRKKKTGKKPGGGADKTERKTERNEEKKGRRAERAAAGGEDDIDALLARFRLQDELHTRVEVQEDCAAPSPRVYATFTPIPSQVPLPGRAAARQLPGQLG